MGQSHFKERFVWLECAIPPWWGDMAADGGVRSQEARRDEHWWAAHFLLSIQAETPAHGGPATFSMGLFSQINLI